MTHSTYHDTISTLGIDEPQRPTLPPKRLFIVRRSGQEDMAVEAHSVAVENQVLQFQEYVIEIRQTETYESRAVMNAYTRRVFNAGAWAEVEEVVGHHLSNGTH